MENIMKDFVQNYGATILYAIITAVASYIGIILKNLYKKYINDQTKKDVVATCVKAVEQLYTDIHGKDKLNKCMESVSDMLEEKGITVSETEIRMLIEAAVNGFNGGFSKDEKAPGEKEH